MNAIVPFALLFLAGPPPDLASRRALRQEICRLSEEAEQLVEELENARHPSEWPLLTQLVSGEPREDRPSLEGVTLAGVGEVYGPDKAFLAAVGFAPLGGGGPSSEMAAFEWGSAFRREGTRWELEHFGGLELLEAALSGSPRERRISRRAGLPLDRFPAFLLAARRYQPERFAQAQKNGDAALAAAIVEETLAGFSLLRFSEVLSSLQEPSPRFIELVRMGKQARDHDRTVMTFDLLEAGKWKKEKLVLVEEGDGWVILETYSNQAERTMAQVRTLATAIEAYAVDNDAYPQAPTVTMLEPLLVPTYIASLPASDAWGTPLEYTAGADGKSYRIRSAGSDRRFQPTRAPGRSSKTEDDLIYEDGTFLAWWEEGDGSETPPRQ
jgi:hypothetical protein